LRFGENNKEKERKKEVFWIKNSNYNISKGSIFTGDG